MRKGIAFGALAIVVALVGFYFFYPQKIVVPDHLCDFVNDTLRLNCVDVLEAEDAMHPGAVVLYREPEKQGEHGRAEIPTLDLLKESCRVPGTAPESVLSGIDKPSQIGLPEFTYELKGALEEGLNLPIPKLEGATIAAGPKFSRVSKVTISNEKAWISTWDEASAARAFASCNIRQDCVDRVRSSRYKVISSTAVAAGLNYNFSDSDNKTIALNGDASKDALTIKAGGNVTFSRVGEAKLTTSIPYVIGVRFFPDDILARVSACAEPILFSADGTTIITVSGGGGEGRIGGPFTVSSALGTPAVLDKKGTEESECDPGLHLTVSEASITAQGDSPKPGSLQFSYDYHLSGGTTIRLTLVSTETQ
jgi:hypothetical protein